MELFCNKLKYDKTMKLFKDLMLSIMMITLLGCSSTMSTQPETVPVQVSQVKPLIIKNIIHLSGNIEGSKTVKTGFMVSGRIHRIYYKEGEKINKGALIAELDPINYQIAKDIADAALRQVQDEYNRIEKMYQQGSVTDADYAKIKNGLAQAQANNDLHAQNLKESKLYAPTQGVLLKKLFEEGEIISTGMPVLVVSDIVQCYAHAFVPEEELKDIHIGQKAKIQVDAIDKNFEGTIAEIGALADGMARSFPVKIKFQNPKLSVRPGMIASIDIATGKEKQALCIPVEAISHNSDHESFVFVVDTAIKKAFKRNVVLGSLADKNIEIAHGLSAGELIVVGGQQKLFNASSISYK